MNTRPAFQMVGSAAENLQNGLQKKSVGFDSTTQKVETDQKLVNSELRYGVLLQARPLLDCLDQMSAETDQRQRSSSKSGVADLMAPVPID